MHKRRANSIALVLAFSLLGASCTTTGQSQVASKSTLPSLEATGRLADGYGILLMSAGRKQKAAREDGANFAGNLPFVSYHIVKRTDESTYEELAFIPAEAGFSNQLDKGYYGFIHYRELPAGEYLAIGNATRGRALHGPGPGMIWADGNRATEIAFAFRIEAGKVNYIGELMTMRGFLRNADILVQDMSERDVAKLHEDNRAAEAVPLTVMLAKPAEIDEMSPRRSY